MLTKASTESNDSDFDDDTLQEAYQHAYSHKLKVRKEYQYLVNHVDALLFLKKLLSVKCKFWRLLLLKKSQNLFRAILSQVYELHKQ